MTVEAVLHWLHVIGAAVLLGTGAGIAFFMVMAARSRNAAAIAAVSRIVVLADFVFTASAVVAQPVTGFWLLKLGGWSLREGWIAWSLALYAAAGAFWLPVVWMQMRMRDIAVDAAGSNAPLPEEFHRLYRIWFYSGFPAFAAVLAIFWLMINKPF